ncbi:MAG: radical SAM protein [Syntrophomonas sp.]
MDKRVKQLVDEALDAKILQSEDIAYLLSWPADSEESFAIQWAARSLSRKLGKAEIHGQVGINSAACPCNCAFCSFAASNGVFKETQVKPLEEILHQANSLIEQGTNAIYLMTTANFDFANFIKIGSQVRRELGPDTVMVANMGDFDLEQARALKAAGFNGVYHAVRLGEGLVTRIPPQKRLETIRHAKQAGLQIGTCVEPVGPEHSIQELVEKILITRQMQPGFSGAMRRINIPGSPLEQYGMVSELRMAQILAVVRLAMGHNVTGNCTHEPCVSGVIAGANLLWAEAGSNPRDTARDTENSRGFDPKRCREILNEAEFPVLNGPSLFFNEP